MPATKRSTALSTVIALMAMLGMTGCQDQAPTDPTVTGIALAKGGGGGKDPKVESTDPTSAPQETRLDVQVFGSSFDDGSSVTFTIDGTPSDLVQTNTTTFVSPKKLIANITIDLAAIEDLYDVEVLSSRGRKGIGADLFSVTKKGKPGEESNFTITDLGPGLINAVADNGEVMVGTLDGQATLWKADLTTVPQPNGTIMYSLSPTGAFGVFTAGIEEGGVWRSEASRLKLIGDTFGERTVLEPLPGHGSANVSGVNDLGQAVGQSHPIGDTDSQRAILWQADGTHEELQGLLGSSANWAKDINSSGYAVGQSTSGCCEPQDWGHAVLWVIGSESVTVINLTPEPFDPQWGWADHVTEEVEGLIQIVGTSRLGGEYRTTFWTVDVLSQPIVVKETFRLGEDPGSPIVVIGNAWALANLGPLPALDHRCGDLYTGAKGITAAGPIAGNSTIFSKGRCGRIMHAVLWTEIN